MNFIAQIDKTKKEVQENTHSYIMGIKFVTYETSREVLNSIKRDTRIYDLERFIVRKNLIILHLKDTTATPSVYYFFNDETYAEVVNKLDGFGIQIVKHLYDED